VPSFPIETAKQRLLAGATRLQLSLDEPRATRMCAYLVLLRQWNKTYNLTAIDEPFAMVDKHLLDSLAVVPFLHGRQVIDVGSGAGLPGIPLSIYYPDFHFCLLDSNGKRVRFLRHVKRSLGLANIDPVHSRSECYRGCFDCVIARAVSGLEALLDRAGHLCSPRGRVLAMKGHPEHLAAEHAEFMETGCHRLLVPGVDEVRSLVVLARHSNQE